MSAASSYLKLLAKPVPAVAGTVAREVIIPPPDPRLDDTESARLQDKLASKLATAEVSEAEREGLTDAAGRALGKLVSDGGHAALSPPDIMALEALVVIDGIRPVVDFRDGALMAEPDRLGEWAEVTLRDAARIEEVAQSVGRINLGDRQMGTGFVVGPHTIMTNRHVLEGLAEGQDGAWRFRGEATIAFGDHGAERGFRLSEQDISTCGLGRDYVLMDVAAALDGGELPGALRLEDSRSFVLPNRPVYIVGYPGKPLPGTERFSLLQRLFNCEYGRKRYCPGEVSSGLGEVAETSDKAVFGHDCTTLGGNSGSPVVDLGESSATVVGVHFAGIRRVSNFAYSLAALRDDLEDRALNYV
ncbi:trypsin-like serine peptidase [Palleronia caenipelagi]|uniref:Trypsin-like peptidase domain-containing protein n=1 Tax=Palleronia caenipelagi TaxID=2489174 RepID=A0A547PQ53_9RHOB|nr:serine protease [Palleronia caenipelagi]TRD16257.1 trypsin-like peptidase domain-containing protein [Palleronia caenipelagi]